MNLGKLQEMVKDREAWRVGAHGVAKSRTRLGNWTATTKAGVGTRNQNMKLLVRSVSLVFTHTDRKTCRLWALTFSRSLLGRLPSCSRSSSAWDWWLRFALQIPHPSHWDSALIWARPILLPFTYSIQASILSTSVPTKNKLKASAVSSQTKVLPFSLGPNRTGVLFLNLGSPWSFSPPSYHRLSKGLHLSSSHLLTLCSTCLSTSTGQPRN